MLIERSLLDGLSGCETHRTVSVLDDGYRFAQPILRIFCRHPRERGDPVITSAFCKPRPLRRTGSPRSRGRRIVAIAVRRLQPQHGLGDDVALDLVGAG